MNESNAIFWLCLNIGSIFVLSYFSMMEMAAVSFNKVRLQYYVSKGDKHAIQLNNLLQSPSRLFGATLIGVNVALIFGSEFARQFHEALGISPDLAPLSQVIIVVIFGELAPMLAARRYAEQVALLGIPFLSFFTKLMSPFLWAITALTKLVHFFMGKHLEEDPNIFLTQEEIQKLLEEQTDEGSGSISEEFNIVVSNIFNLRSKTASETMNVLENNVMIPSNYTIGHVRQIFQTLKDQDFLPVYNLKKTNIIGIAFPRDLLRETDTHRIRNHTRAPWFVSHSTEIIQILKQFRRNNQNVAVVLDDKGLAIGMLTLEDILEEIFGKTLLDPQMPSKAKTEQPIIEKTFPGNMKIAEFNSLYESNIDPMGEETFAGLIVKMLGHLPEAGEIILIPPFEIKVREVSLLEIKSITIKTRV